MEQLVEFLKRRGFEPNVRIFLSSDGCSVEGNGLDVMHIYMLYQFDDEFVEIIEKLRQDGITEITLNYD